MFVLLGASPYPLSSCTQKLPNNIYNMGRRIQGLERKERHTITIDSRLAARATTYGKNRNIIGLSGAIERLVQRALDNCAGDADLDRRTSRIEAIIAIRLVLENHSVDYEEFPIFGAYRADFRANGHYIIAGINSSSAFDAASALYQHRRAKIIAVVPSCDLPIRELTTNAKHPSVRIMDLAEFDRWAKKKGRPRKQPTPVVKDS